jgi:hypothetical protein
VLNTIVTFCFSFAGASSPDMEPSYGGGLFDMVKGGAGRLFSNLKDNLKDTLKDTSSRVIQSVSRCVHSSWPGWWNPGFQGIWLLANPLLG